MQKKNNKLKTNVICRGRCPQRPEKKEQGITLIALIITIIVMLILVAVTIRTAVNSGLFKHAEDATNKWADAQRDESNIGENVDEIIGQYVKKEHDWKREGDNISCAHCNLSFVIGDYVDYKPDATTKTVTVTANESGIKTPFVYDDWGFIPMFAELDISETGSQTFTQESETYWRVIGIEDSNKDGISETLLIKMASPTNQVLALYGAATYNNGPDIMNKIAKELYSSSEYGEARSITAADINNSLQYTPSGGTSYHDGGYIEFNEVDTPIRDLPEWNAIKASGTFTPDGSNTEEKLGSHKANGYNYHVAEIEGQTFALVFNGDSYKSFQVSSAAYRTIMFNVSNDPSMFWISDKCTTVSFSSRFKLGFRSWLYRVPPL